MLSKASFLTKNYRKSRKTENFKLLFCYNEIKLIVDLLKPQTLKTKKGFYDPF
ncbi:hypothetical protein LG21E20_05200 [Lactococcus formosensis]|nr:hypothetical protein LG21E20_05200 [Lactococcus formosensis]BDX24442.1 hypothetical protein LFMS200408A_05190 [Lactococcus formosensis]